LTTLPDAGRDRGQARRDAHRPGLTPTYRGKRFPSPCNTAGPEPWNSFIRTSSGGPHSWRATASCCSYGAAIR